MMGGNGDSMMIGGMQFIFCPPDAVWLMVCDGCDVQLFLLLAAAIAETAAAAAAMPAQVIVMTIV